ncbi:MAG: L,D-transpeptidase family protein [Candidatus Competibacteraceae bacterium]|nr:L,D-transpeptidase family protein [Candidatus Competibacteraceae bacterium]
MPSQSLKPVHWLLLGGMFASTAQATVYPLPSPDTDVIGELKVIYAKKEDTLIDIARAHGLGYDEMVHANPGVDRWSPGQGTPIVLPLRHILPNTPREGIVLNIPEMRVYYYPAGEQVVHTYPVSIGRMDWKTPLGTTKVIGKEVDPPWRPPASIKAEHAKEGDILPDVVPGGPGNPLGRHAMRLGVPGYLIHGTDKPYGIGMQVTHGCVRMYPEDIEHLFGMVPMGTTVRLIDQPVKVGRSNGELLLEAHQPLEEDESPIKVTLAQVQKAVIAKTGPDMPGVDQIALQAAVDQISGMPVSISGTDGSTPAGSISDSQPPPGAAYPTARVPLSPPNTAPTPYRPSTPPATASLAPSDPIVNRTPPPAPTAPSNYPYSSNRPAPAYPLANTAPGYPVTNRAPNPYPAPYASSSAPPAAYRPAPATPPSRYVPYGSAGADQEEQPPYRPATTATSRPVDIPAYRSAPAVPLDTPAYRSAPSSLPVETPGYRPAPLPPRYPRNPGAANYEDEAPPYPSTTTTLTSPSAPSTYRPVPSGSPVPYPRPVTPMVPPAPRGTPADPLEPPPVSRL